MHSASSLKPQTNLKRYLFTFIPILSSDFSDLVNTQNLVALIAILMPIHKLTYTHDLFGNEGQELQLMKLMWTYLKILKLLPKKVTYQKQSIYNERKIHTKKTYLKFFKTTTKKVTYKNSLFAVK